MTRMLVIADDLSGAAEIAGIARRFGLQTRLAREPHATVSQHVFEGVTVLDTDSRLLSASDASGVVARFVAGVSASAFDLIFKKTDSALRGPLLAEVETLMDRLGFASAVLVPQNPGRGRTIEGGVYRIDGVPLDQTAFANDPIHPVRTAEVLQVLGVPARRRIRCIEPGGDAPNDEIIVGGAKSLDDVRRWANVIAAGVLPVGGADFFASVLKARGLSPIHGFIDSLGAGLRLFICGSASRDGAGLVARAGRIGIPVLAMPNDVRDDARDRAGAWGDAVIAALARAGVAVAVVGCPLDRGAGAARRIEAALGELAAGVLGRKRVDHLFLEGGATAAAVCGRMGWRELAVCGELATGVVHLRAPDGQRLAIKPGSYAWPDAAWR